MQRTMQMVLLTGQSQRMEVMHGNLLPAGMLIFCAGLDCVLRVHLAARASLAWAGDERLRSKAAAKR